MKLQQHFSAKQLKLEQTLSKYWSISFKEVGCGARQRGSGNY